MAWDDGFFNNPFRKILIQNLHDQSVNHYTIDGPYSNFFLEKLLPLFNDLNQCGNNERYKYSLEVIKLRADNNCYQIRLPN